MSATAPFMSCGKGKGLSLPWLCQGLLGEKSVCTCSCPVNGDTPTPGPAVLCRLFASVASLASGAGSSGDTGDAPGWELLWGWMVPMAFPVPEAPTMGQGPPRLLLAALAGDEASPAALGGLPKTPLLLPASHTSCSAPVPALGDSRSPSPRCRMGRGKDLPKDFGGCGRGHKSALMDDFRFVSVACH